MVSKVRQIDAPLNLCEFVSLEVSHSNAPIPTWLASELELLWEVDIAEAVSGCWRAEKEDGDG